MSYLTHEVQLSKRHEEILAQRTILLQQMESQLEDQKSGKQLQAIESKAANKRNATLLKDLEAAEERLEASSHMHPHPSVATLKTRYWASVEQELPNWEQFLLGQRMSPIQVRKRKYEKKTQKEITQEKGKVAHLTTPPHSPKLKS
ncbi:uncharacterized protein C3orf14 homolog [Callorhinchus milii]|uniref:Uncharacterized protein n=1 Tax=Callorhinchus milii TaxID=7868 RepID=A0A4W3H6G8_CALMI|nr:uncharacterized protein C3orf14 homolog [Callorhinchus milii]|eukprot:gi/632955210/ref/XP_007893357.1/ PREDICTED: uncharacterized protein C3orf14 homolog [Callorhinchus milii]